MKKYEIVIWAVLALLLPIVSVLAFKSWRSQPVQSGMRGATLGVRVSKVGRDSVVVHQVSQYGQRFGFQVGDEIVQVNGQSIKSKRDFVSAAAKIRSGEKISVILDRNDSLVSFGRAYRGPIGETRIETAASQGIQITSKKSRPSSKKVAQVNSEIRPASQNLATQNLTRITSPDVSPALPVTTEKAPGFVPPFKKRADWIGL